MFEWLKIKRKSVRELKILIQLFKKSIKNGGKPLRTHFRGFISFHVVSFQFTGQKGILCCFYPYISIITKQFKLQSLLPKLNSLGLMN